MDTPLLESNSNHGSFFTRFEPLFSILLKLWAAFAMTSGVGVIVFAFMEVMVTDVSLWDAFTGNDAPVIPLLFSVPCLLALFPYLLMRMVWKKAYVIYIALIGLMIVLLGGVWIMNDNPNYAEGYMAREFIQFLMIGLTLASLIAFFATKMVQTRRGQMIATIIGIIYIGMYGLNGFAL